MPVKIRISLPPPPEFGIHAHIFRIAAILHRKHASFESALTTIKVWRDNQSFRRPVTDSELTDAVHAVYRNLRERSPHVPVLRRETPPKWPTPDPSKRARLIDSEFGLADLWESSPMRFNDAGPRTTFILSKLFPGDPLLCCGWAINLFQTEHLSEWNALHLMSHIVPSPMTSKQGARKKDGQQSAHTVSNTGPRMYLVLDFDDHAGLDTHAATAVFLERMSGIPMVMALHSGGKSLHAWFYVVGLTDPQLVSFMRVASECGADPAMWLRSQFARMPDGLRNNGQKQTVYYFNPLIISHE